MISTHRRLGSRESRRGILRLAGALAVAAVLWPTSAFADGPVWQELDQALAAAADDAPRPAAQLSGRTAEGEPVADAPLRALLDRLERELAAQRAGFEKASRHRLPAKAALRLARARAAHAEGQERVLRQLQATVAAPALGPLRAQRAAELRALLAPVVEASRREPLSSELNVRAPGLRSPGLRSPGLPVALGVAPSAAAPEAVSAIGPVPSAIGSLAGSLRGPIEAYAWVRNNVRTEFYYGSIKGPLQTLLDGSGNDADSAALLIALLRAMGVPARFLQGTAEVEIARLQSITGTRNAEQAVRVLERAGIPHEVVTGAGGIASVKLARVLCEAYVPYANYRGLPQDAQGKLWLPLDAGFRDLHVPTGLDVVSELGLDPRALVDEYLTAPRAITPREFLRQRVTAELATSGRAYEEALNDRSVIPEELGILPNALPYRLVGPTDADYDAPLAHQVRVVGESSGGVVLEATLSLPDVLGKRLTLSYVPFDDDDAAVVAQYGSLAATPPYLIEVKPVLKVGGVVVAAGSGAVGMAVKYDLRVTLTGPGGAQEIRNRVLAGNLMAIGLGGGAQAIVEPGASNAAALLATAASEYLQRWNHSDEELADVLRVVPVRPTASACFVMSDMDVEYAGGDPLYPISFVWKGVAIDADLRPSSPVGVDERAAEARFTVMSGLEGSMLESRVFEDLWQVGSVSTAMALQIAASQGVSVVMVSRDTVDATLPGLPLDPEVAADVREAALRGFVVRVPAAPVSFLAWTGVGWWVLDEATGESAWMLQGGHSGGVTAAAVIDWPDALAETLADQGEAAAPEDSVVARLQRFVSTDFQEGVVAKPLARAFRVLALDELGQRVPNAQVTFQVLGGGGAFLDPATGKPGESQLVVRSNARGEAEATLVLGRSTSEIPRFACLEPDPESCSLENEVYATQVGLNLVAVRSGAADLPEPFSAYAKPDDRFDGQYRYANITMKTWPSGAAVANLTVAGLLAVNIRDPYENPISNFHVRFAYAAPPELGVPPSGYATARPATSTPGKLLRLRDYEGCLERGPSPAYGSCPGEVETLVVPSSTYGAVAYPVLGDSPYSVYRFDIGTPIVPDFGFVKIGTWGRICRPDCTQWANRWPITLVDVGGRPVLVGPTANLIEAYPPGGKASMRFNAQAVYEGYTVEPYVDDSGKKHYRVVGNNQWTREPLDDSNFTLTARTAGTGTPASATYAGNGAYEAPMTMGAAPQLNTVGYEVKSTAWLIPQDLPDHPDEVDPAAVDEITLQITKRKFPDKPNVQSGAFSLWGVRAAIESITPQPLGLDEGRVRDAAVVKPRVEPAAYLAELAPTNLWFTLSRDDRPVLSASGTDGSPFHIPAGLAFPPGDYAGQLSIPSVSADGLGISSPPYPLQSCLPLELLTPVVVLPLSSTASTTSACQTQDRIRFKLCSASAVTLQIAGQVVTAKVDGVLKAIEGLELAAGEHQVEVPRALVEAFHDPAVPFDLRAAPLDAPLAPRFASGVVTISTDLIALVTPEVKIKQTVDYDNGTVCSEAKPLRFAVCDGVRATIKVDGSVLVASIDGGAAMPLDGVALAAGLHIVEVPASVVSPTSEQQKPFVVAAVLLADPAVRDEAEGVISGTLMNQSVLPVGHTFVKGVDLFDGHVATSEVDLSVPGRHLGLEMSRTYSSATNEGTSAMGAGWGWSYGLSLHVPRTLSCELAVLSTRDGTQLFRTTDGGATYSPQKGYHGRLVRDTATLAFDYFDKSAVQHHFEPGGSDPTEMRIAWIREPHGDRLAMTYDGAGRAITVAEQQGGTSVRELRLTYTSVHGADRIKTADIVKANGTALGLSAVYQYDADWGNLDSVTRRGTNLAGARRAADRQSLYRYSVDNPRDRHQLTEIRLPNEPAPAQTTQYQYYARNTPLPGEGSQLLFGPDKEERVQVVTELPDTRRLETRFVYDLREAISSRRYSTTVTPPARPATVYLQDGNGLTLEVREPLGRTTTMSWYPDVRKETEKDANQRLTRYTWDGNGNLASETVETGDPDLGNVPVTRAVYDAVYNVLTSRTDAEDHTTAWSVNAATGDVAGMTDAEGNATGYEYDGGAPAGPGLLSRTVDARGNATTFDDYNDFGQARVIRDALGNETHRTYDERGRLVEESDSLGRQAFYEYDGLDRRLRSRRVAGAGSDDEDTQAEYYPHGERLSETNANKAKTVTAIDGLGRVVATTTSVRGGPLRTAIHFDDAGNKDLETDRRGVRRRCRYDDLNRLTAVEVEAGPAGSTGPLGEVAAFAYDLVGNKLSEKDVAGLQTDLEYDRLYRLKTKLLPEVMPAGHTPAGRLTERFGYDRVGNRTNAWDANAHETRYEYDRLNRLRRTTQDPGGLNLVATARYCNAPAADPAGGSGINKCEELQQPRGLRTLYDYDELNRERSRRVRLEGPDGEPAAVEEYVTATRYDDPAHVVRVEDPNHNVSLARLDGLDRLVEQVIDEGRLSLRTTIEYDGLGNKKRVVDPRGNPTTSFFDGLGRLYQQTDASNKSAFYSYDGGGLRTKATDRRGVTTRMEFDNLGREVRGVLETTPFSGRAWSRAVGYRDRDRLRIETDARGKKTTFTLDGLGRVLRETDSLQRFALSQWDGVNKVEQSDKRPEHHVTTFGYDALDRLMLTTDPAPFLYQVRTRYLDAANQVEETDRRGTIKRTQLDPLGRVRSITDAVGQPVQATLERNTYDGDGNKLVALDAESRRTDFTYDGANRLVSRAAGVGTPDASLTTYGYDFSGNQDIEQDQRARDAGQPFSIKRVYDRLNIVQDEFDGEGHHTVFAHDEEGHRTLVQAPKGQRTLFEYDELGKLLTVTQPRTAAGVPVTHHGYDENRNRTLQTDARSNDVVMEYDDLNRLEWTIQPGTLRTHVEYDEDGNVTRITDPNGNVITSQYDELGRLQAKDYAYAPGLELPWRRSVHVEHEYDENGNVTAVHEDVASGTDPPVRLSTLRVYDRLDRLEHETSQTPYGQTVAVGYSYFGNGLRKSVTDTAGATTAYEYDGQNRLLAARSNAGTATEQTTSYSYWPDGLAREVQSPNGVKAAYLYDNADRLKNLTNTRGGTVVSSYGYTYDVNGNRDLQVEVNGGLTETTRYEYDVLDRLEQIHYPVDATHPTGRNVSYAYDLVGNRTTEREADAGASATVRSDRRATFDAVNRLTAIDDTVDNANDATFTYDDNGNQRTKTTGGVASTYVYDATDRLAEVRSSASGSTPIARFQYDVDGRRTLKIGAPTTPGDSGTRQFVYDQTSVLQELDSAGQPVARYDWGNDRLISLSRVEGPTVERRYYSFDALGSVTNLTDAAGVARASYHLDAWGNYRFPAELQASTNRFGFTGYVWDRETELYFAKARFYDPEVGRFTSQDSFLGEINEPPSLHRFFYANDNPTRFIDPTGHFTLDSLKKDALNATTFALDTFQNFQEEAGKAYDQGLQGVANLLIPGASARARVAAGQDPGIAGGQQLKLLDAASNPQLSLTTRISAFAEGVRAQPAVIVEETVIRPALEAPGQARAAGVHLAQAELSTNPVDKAVHTLAAVSATAQAFTGFATPAAIVPGGPGTLARPSADDLAAAPRLSPRLAPPPVEATSNAALDMAPAKGTAQGGQYDVWEYTGLREVAEPGLQAHHVGQKALMKRFVSGYDPRTAPSILVPPVGHTIKGPRGIVSRSTEGFTSARDVLARDIRELRRVYPDIPNSQLQNLLEMNRQLYPELSVKAEAAVSYAK